ncbi:MAG TPA: single-stranded-DNA-specific exonuclease RecJ [Gemmatimonadales bacterium]|nr:single-stranded-DNA-specific exonuclease RecJ [Gemmatimonadales bacterium]
MRRDPLPRRGDRLIEAPRWRLAAPPDPGAAGALASALGIPAPLAALLVQRGLGAPEAARAFLRPSLETLGDPYALAGMTEAITVLVAAIRAGETILVHGDYDVDGQCATALLVRALRAAGAKVHAFVPHRLTDGYDFGPAGLAEAERLGAGLIVTCDCGVQAVDTVRAAKVAGRRVIITDHHLPGAMLPEADAVIDPQRSDDTSGLTMLCGTGIAFKVVQALVPALGLPAHLHLHLLDYVAVATIADVVPLVGENRVLVRHGLKLLAASRWAGWQALIEQAKLAGSELRAGQVGFILAPRLNAAGRVADAKVGVQLLTTDDPAEAQRLAAQCERWNTERQAMDQAIQEEALARVARDYADPEAHRALVIDGEGWHPGVIGIVASRVVERYGRPTFMVGVSGEVGKGSGRSIDGFDLHAALAECDDLLERWGGHRMAAGLTIRRDRIPAFRDRFRSVAAERLTLDELGPTQRVDLEVTPLELTEDLERLGRHLEPCGMGNPAPVFGVRAARLAEPRTVGSNHLKARLTAPGTSLDAIAFGWADRATFAIAGAVDVALRLERNEWQGRSSLQARILALAPAGVTP